MIRVADMWIRQDHRRPRRPNNYFLYVDYLVYAPKTGTVKFAPDPKDDDDAVRPRLLTPERERLLRLRRLLPLRPEDTDVVPKISFFPASNPKIPSFHTCAPKPQPYIFMPYFL